MSTFWLSRALRTLVTLWLVVTFAFVVLRTSGDPVVALLSPDALPDEIAHFRALWNLDRSLPEQYLAYIGNLFAGDFGVSYHDGRPVLAIIAERLPNTLLLGGCASRRPKCACIAVTSAFFDRSAGAAKRRAGPFALTQPEQPEWCPTRPPKFIWER